MSAFCVAIEILLNTVISKSTENLCYHKSLKQWIKITEKCTGKNQYSRTNSEESIFVHILTPIPVFHYFQYFFTSLEH